MKKTYYDKQLSKEMIKWLYESGVYSLDDMVEYVKLGIITKDDFHLITRYNYDGYCAVNNIE